MADRFDDYLESPGSPAGRARAPTLSDTEDLADVAKSIHVNSAGIIRGILVGNPDTEVHNYTVVAGMPYPYRFRRVFATTTTAGFIVFV